MQPLEQEYNYSDAIEELVDNHVITPEQIYYYAGHRLEIAFDHMFQFSQKCLLEKCKRANYNVEPSQFYFSKSLDVNAFAHSRKNGFFHIEINRGTIEKLYSLFCDHNIIDDPELYEYERLNEFLEKSDFEVSLQYLMFEWALEFIFYHELGHLIQFTNQEASNGLTNNVQTLQEMYLKEVDDFDIYYHVIEFDADLHGSQELGGNLHYFWTLLPSEAQTHDNLKKIIVSALTGVLGFFTMVADQPYSKIYYYEKSHPHPFIRLMWSSQSLINNIEIHHPGINNNNEIINETIRVMNIYLKHHNLGSIQNRYINPFFNDQPFVLDYMHAIGKLAQGGKYEFLASNTIHKR